MSLRRRVLVALVVAGCAGSSMKTEQGEPQTAKEKQMQEARASGELDKPNSKGAKWRYSGERNDCRYVVGGRCFKGENAACQASHCKAPKKCSVTGGGPATVSCK